MEELQRARAKASNAKFKRISAALALTGAAAAGLSAMVSGGDAHDAIQVVGGLCAAANVGVSDMIRDVHQRRDQRRIFDKFYFELRAHWGLYDQAHNQSTQRW